MLLPVRTVGVMGDFRTYDFVVGLRAVTSTDGMTADFYPFDMAFIGRVATRIVNEVKGVNRVVYDDEQAAGDDRVGVLERNRISAIGFSTRGMYMIKPARQRGGRDGESSFGTPGFAHRSPSQALVCDPLRPGADCHRYRRPGRPFFPRDRHCAEAAWRRLHRADQDDDRTGDLLHGRARIASMRDLQKIGRVGLKTLVYFEVVSTFALLIGLIVGEVLQPGKGFNIDPATLDANAVSTYVTQAKDQSIVQHLLGIIPTPSWAPSPGAISCRSCWFRS